VTAWLLAFNFIHFMAAFLGSIYIWGQWSSFYGTWFIGPKTKKNQIEIESSVRKLQQQQQQQQ
jgi:hypothetical protein